MTRLPMGCILAIEAVDEGTRTVGRLTGKEPEGRRPARSAGSDLEGKARRLNVGAHPIREAILEATVLNFAAGDLRLGVTHGNE